MNQSIDVKLHTEHDMLDHLTALVESAGTQKAVAHDLGISSAYLGDVLHGKRGVSSEMAERLGFEMIKVFVRRK